MKTYYTEEGVEIVIAALYSGPWTYELLVHAPEYRDPHSDSYMLVVYNADKSPFGGTTDPYYYPHELYGSLTYTVSSVCRKSPTEVLEALVAAFKSIDING